MCILSCGTAVGRTWDPTALLGVPPPPCLCFPICKNKGFWHMICEVPSGLGP